MIRSRNKAATTVHACMLALVVFPGCASSPETRPPCAPPTPIAITILGTPRLNPDAEGRALPTEVRIYQLRDATVFDMAAFEDIWSSAANVLEGALVSEEALTLYPGERLERRVQPADDAAALVGVAIVREPRGRTWRAIVPITRRTPSDSSCLVLEPSRIAFRLDDYRIEAMTPRTNLETRQ